MNDKIDIIEILLQDSNTAFLAISSVMASVVTLLYSIAFSKHDELIVICGIIKHGNKDPLVKAKKKSTINHIKRVKKALKQSFLIFVVSLINCVLSWIALGCRDSPFKVLLLVVISITAILIIYLVIKLICKLVRLYYTELKT